MCIQLAHVLFSRSNLIGVKYIHLSLTDWLTHWLTDWLTDSPTIHNILDAPTKRYFFYKKITQKWVHGYNKYTTFSACDKNDNKGAPIHFWFWKVMDGSSGRKVSISIYAKTIISITSTIAQNTNYRDWRSFFFIFITRVTREDLKLHWIVVLMASNICPPFYILIQKTREIFMSSDWPIRARVDLVII